MYIVMARIIASLLSTHHYPAFRHVEDVDTEVTNGTKPCRKRRRTELEGTDVSREDAKDDGKDDLDEDTKARPWNNRMDAIRLNTANPQDISNYKIWGDVTELPNTSGVYVPYVRELAVADLSTTPSLFSTYLLRCLAQDHDHMLDEMEKLVSAWGSIQHTDVGHEMSHLCKCIDIALKVQATVFPIYTATIYEGTVICGAGYRIGMNTRWYDPLPYEQLQQEIRELSAHSLAIAEIKRVVDDTDKEESIEQCTSVRMLAKLLLGIGLDEFKQNDIRKVAHQLGYSCKYWSTSTTNIGLYVDYLHKKDTDIPDDIPMHPDYMFTTKRYESLLSAFGKQAPSFMITGGTRLELDGDVPKHLHVRTVTTPVAVKDMEHIMNERYITNNMQNTSSRHRDTNLTGSLKDEVWAQLKDIITENSDKDTNDDYVPWDPGRESASANLW
jgi:hypothetical protein